MKKKPSKRQRTIMDLMSLIDQEGFHYGLIHYGKEHIDSLKDQDLSDLFSAFRIISQQLESKIDELGKEVEPLLDDDSDF